MIDTHCHLTFTQYEGQIPAELDRMREAGVRGCITVGTTSADSVAGLAIAEAHEGVWCSAGVHPLHSDEPVDWGALRACAQHPRCVAWGELGLDNHYATPGKAHQMAALEGQLDRMVRWREEGIVKPVIIHCRKAFDELLPMLAASGLPRDRFVFPLLQRQRVGGAARARLRRMDQLHRHRDLSQRTRGAGGGETDAR